MREMSVIVCVYVCACVYHVCFCVSIYQVQGFTQRPRNGRINHVTVQIEKSRKTGYEEISHL